MPEKKQVFLAIASRNVGVRFMSNLRKKFPVCLVSFGFIASVFFFGLALLPYANPPETSVREVPDCGAISLYLICKHEGHGRSLDYLRELTRTSPSGTNMYNLKEAAEALGYQVQAYRGDFAKLCGHVANPHRYAILHYGTGHFVAAVPGGSGNRVRVMDIGSASEIEDLTASELRDLKQWHGDMLLLTPLTE